MVEVPCYLKSSPRLQVPGLDVLNPWLCLRCGWPPVCPTLILELRCLRSSTIIIIDLGISRWVTPALADASCRPARAKYHSTQPSLRNWCRWPFPNKIHFEQLQHRAVSGYIELWKWGDFICSHLFNEITKFHNN